MKTNLSFLKQVGIQLMLMISIVYSISIFGQNTVVDFPFTNVPAGNGLKPDFLDAGYDGVILPIPTLTYFLSIYRRNQTGNKKFSCRTV